MSDLFPEVEQSKRTRKSNRAEVARLKAKHGIWTHNAPGAGEWLALRMTDAVERLKGYALSEAEKTNPFELIAGYSRLLDEAGLMTDGHPTEFEAVKHAVENIK